MEPRPPQDPNAARNALIVKYVAGLVVVCMLGTVGFIVTRKPAESLTSEGPLPSIPAPSQALTKTAKTALPLDPDGDGSKSSDSFLSALGHDDGRTSGTTTTLPPVTFPQGNNDDRSERLSPNWAGYTATGAAYTSVSGSWTQPSASCAGIEQANTSPWVGLDGWGSESVEQTGTSATCEYGVAHQYAWYEFFPEPAMALPRSSYPVTAGDKITASVKKSGQTFTLTIGSAASSSHAAWTFTKSGVVPDAKAVSAEWIVEAPADAASGAIYDLAPFSPVTFTNCVVTVDGKSSTSAASANAVRSDIVDSSAAIRTSTSKFGSGGTGFTTSYQ